MKKALFFLFILSFCSNLFASNTKFNPHTGRLDYIGSDSVSDIDSASGECTAGEVLESDGAGGFTCEQDDSGGAGSTRVSEDGVHVVSADTINFTTGLKATTLASGKATVSGDMATTTTPGIVSLDSTDFSIGSFGGVSLTVPGSDTQNIFNDGGNLGADAGYTYDKTLNELQLGDGDFGNASQTDTKLEVTATSGDAISVRSSTGISSIYLARSNGTLASPTAPNDGNQIGSINSLIYDSAAWRFSGYLQFIVDGDVGSGDVPTAIALGVAADGGSTASSVLTIKNTRNVGIGSDGTPDAALEISNAGVGGVYSGVTEEKPTLLTGSGGTFTLADGTTISDWRINNFTAHNINGIAGGGTETITNAATAYISAAPSGSNITISNPYALWVDSGTTRLDGSVAITPLTNCNTLDTDGSGVLSCGTDEGGAGGVFPRVSEDGTAIASADTVNYTTGIKAISDGGTKVIVSGDMATVTTPGIASFDTTHFAVGPFGGVTINSASITATELGVDSVSSSELNATGVEAELEAVLDLDELQGTLDVESGGTEATSLTDGGVLLGSGTGAITPMAVLADGEIIVGDGTTDPVALAAFSSATGTLKVANGGTALASVSNDAVLVGNNAGTGYDQPALPNCTDSGGNHLNYTAATGNFTCGTSGDGGGSSAIFPMVSEDGVSVVSADTVNYSGINVANSSGKVTVSPKWEVIFSPQSAKLPLINPAQIDAGSPNWKLLFDATTGERVSFDTLIPRSYAGGSISMDVNYTMASATSGGVVFGVQVMCVTPGDSTVFDSNSFDSYVSSDQTVPGTAGHEAQMGVSVVSKDSLAANDHCVFRVSRDTVAASDNAAGDFEGRKIRIYEV